MAEDLGSTVPRRQLGRALRELRVEARMTLDGVAEALQYSRQKVWRIESGLGPTRPLDVRLLCELFSANPELAAALVGLAGETKARGWWQSYGSAVPEWFELYVGLESAASRLRGYDESLIPGLLQTRAYARGVYQNRTSVSDDELDQFIRVRQQRQAMLKRRLPRPPALQSVLSESVLIRCVGNSAVMTEQLEHLLELTALPHVSIRVLPLAAGPQYGALAGTFMMLDFPPGKRTTPEPSVVYSESLTGALYLDRPEELAAYEKVWSSLDGLALDEEQSGQLIDKIISEVHYG
ncbi:helix-turn-helix domain-containing protein [Micromonospora yangpuensis]|uniref:Helix-turn-helix domain-containing protein n=1 Tax=Micromonospora yangpuensis TaxID=683228 RepID=A0A1C6UET9_9ACTN|nr:helix-turn-helix transcriptional regulator [Micromonospora yangpuensis]GGM06017.1 transcriptional regulator [Micromonospora yangpuensis]SCL52600.1 Helix-turn-helix domain-containing protein [Micromonospora yangpuensis]